MDIRKAPVEENHVVIRSNSDLESKVGTCH